MAKKARGTKIPVWMGDIYGGDLGSALYERRPVGRL